MKNSKATVAAFRWPMTASRENVQLEESRGDIVACRLSCSLSLYPDTVSVTLTAAARVGDEREWDVANPCPRLRALPLFAIIPFCQMFHYKNSGQSSREFHRHRLQDQRLKQKMNHSSFLAFVLTLSCFACVSCRRIRSPSTRLMDFTPCSSVGADSVRWVKITPCTKDPCVFKPGSKVTITVSAVAPRDINSATLQAYVAGMNQPFPGFQMDICDQAACPIKKGTTFLLTQTLTIPEVPTTVITSDCD